MGKSVQPPTLCPHLLHQIPPVVTADDVFYFFDIPDYAAAKHPCSKDTQWRIWVSSHSSIFYLFWGAQTARHKVPGTAQHPPETVSFPFFLATIVRRALFRGGGGGEGREPLYRLLLHFLRRRGNLETRFSYKAKQKTKHE